jgi:hypothetical protein
MAALRGRVCLGELYQIFWDLMKMLRQLSHGALPMFCSFISLNKRGLYFWTKRDYRGCLREEGVFGSEFNCIVAIYLRLNFNSNVYNAFNYVLQI